MEEAAGAADAGELWGLLVRFEICSLAPGIERQSNLVRHGAENQLASLRTRDFQGVER